METNEKDQFNYKYEKKDIDDLILAILKKHPNGLPLTDLIEKMPQDLNQKVIEGFLLLLINSGKIVPEYSFRLNDGKTTNSKFTGIFNDQITALQNEVLSGL